MTRLATGIEGFDAMVQGGLPSGSSVVLQGPPGQEKLRFALTFLAEGLKSGGSGLVVISTQSPDAVLAELRGLGVDLDAVTAENRLRIVDWYSWSEETVLDIEERGIVIRSSIDLTNVGVALSRAIAAISGNAARRAVIELLSPAMNAYELTQVYAFAQTAKKKFDRHGFTSLILLEKDMHSGPEVTTLHQPFDGVIEVERTRSGDRILRKIGVLHLKDTAPDPTFRILEMTESGMRVVRETTKPSAAAPSVGAMSGAVLESQEERARRLSLIMQIASERLKLNPKDTDALFAMAAAQATLDDPRGGLQSLDRLADLDPNYPGLWVLKTKLHARLGEADRARQSRMRADEADLPSPSAVGLTVPCPMCDAPVAEDATTCGNCGVKFAATRKLEEELEDLGRAAIQEMVQEELGEGAPLSVTPESGKPKPVNREPEPAPAPKPELGLPSNPSTKKGLTNGLVLSRSARRRAGMTNGLKGRTNGLRDRTNGLTNGLGRTNGLTKGVGRTNGLTNGLGRTNGLTNGLGRTNGLTNGLGRTNGLTNGLGRTNGLTNGLAGARPTVFRSTSIRGMMRTAGWKLYVIPLVVVGLLMMPLFFVPEYHGPSFPIQIDGQFNDWAAQATEPMAAGTTVNPNIDVNRFGVVSNLGPYAFYVEVAGSALMGGGVAPGTMDTIRIFVDIDGSAATGYLIDGLGADRMIDVSGHDGTVLSNTLWEFDSNRDHRDWNGWIKGTATPAAAGGSRIEAEAGWLADVPASVPVVATVHTTSWDGQTDSGDFPVSPGLGTLSVVADPQVPDVLAGSSVSLLRLTLTAHGQPVTLNSIQVEIAGTSPANAATSLALTDGATMLSQVVPTSRNVQFSFAPMQIAVDVPTSFFVVGDFASTTGETFGVRLPSSHPFGIGAGVVALRQNGGVRTLGYLGSVPSSPRVDGAFDEWTALSSDPMNDVGPRGNSNIDLGQYGALRGGASTFLYAEVAGRILQGTPTPEHPRQAPPQGSQGPADTDRDGVPDTVDPLPQDFNNDGTPDAQTNGDYDADGVVDYGLSGGTDFWLNTTIPDTFPAPYAGLPVTLYIGPDNRPVALGEDVLRIFLDIDNSSFSGYSIGGIGADRLLEIRGKDGAVSQSALLAFAGSFPGQWGWTPLSPVTVALGYHAVELSVSLNATRLYVETGDFWESVDSTTTVPAFVSLTSSFRVAPASVPLSVPWAAAGPQTTAVRIDPGSSSTTTLYNQQRKVVRAGDVAGQTACDNATNSDGCWYAVLQDQFSEAPSNTQASTETITTGSKIAGSFPTDIQSLNDISIQYREVTDTAEAAGAYQSNTGTNALSSPKTRTWDGSSWSLETEEATAGSALRAVRMAFSPMTSNQRIIVTLSDDGWLDAYVCTATCAATNNIGRVWSSAPSTAAVPFDIAYEQLSGDALLVYGVLDTNTARDIAYKVYQAGSWSVEQYADDATEATDIQYTVIKLASQRGTDRIGVVGGDGTTTGGNAWIWSGTAFGNFQEIDASIAGATHEEVALGWESSAGRLVAVAIDGGVPRVSYRVFTPPSTWSAYAQSIDCGSGSASWVRLKPNPLSTANDMILALGDNRPGLGTCYWNGATFINGQTHDSAIDAAATRPFDFAWENTGSKGLLVWGTAAGQITYRSYTAPNTWNSVANLAMGTNVHSWVSLRTNPFPRTGATKILGAVMENTANDLGAISWDGATFAVVGSSTFTADTGATTYETYDLKYHVTNSDQLSVRYDWSGVPSGDTYTLLVKGYREDENIDVQTLTPPSTWNTVITITATTNTLYSYTLTSAEYNSGAPAIRFVDASGPLGMQSDLWVDYTNIVSSPGSFDIWLHPNGPGTYANTWTGYSGGGSGCNLAHQWLCVNDDPPTGTMLSTSTVSQKQDFTMEDVNIQPGYTDIDVTWFARCLKNGGGSGGQISHLVREVDGTAEEDVGADKEITCPGTYFNFTYFMEQSPGGGEWTPAEINALQCGVVSSSDVTPVPAVDQVRCEVQVTGGTINWDRIVIMRSADTSGSTWGSQVILASGRSADNPLLLTRDSAEPSIAIDSAGFLHVVWVSAPTAGNQNTMNLVRYTKTTVAYPTQAQLASGANWQAVTTVDDPSTGYMPTISTDTSNNPHIAWSNSRTSGPTYYKNKATGAWQFTVVWPFTPYTGISVDVSPQNNFVSVARYYEAGTNEIQYTVCKDLSTSKCDSSTEFKRWDNTSGYDTVATGVETGSYPSLVTTYEANGDLWIAYAKVVDGTTRSIQARFLDYPSGGWAAAETVDSISGTIFTRPSIGVDRNNNVHALYVATSGPQLYYKERTASWGTRTPVDAFTDNPTILLRAPNDVTYGSDSGGLYWKTSASETFFYYIAIPEFGELLFPIAGVLSLVLIMRFRSRSRPKRVSE